MSALLSVASTLLGGILGQSAEKRNNAYQAQLIREQNAYNAPDQVRARAEAAGFNPLLFVGPGVGQQTATAASASSNYMGSAIADAGLMLADAVAKRKDVMRLSRMEDQNRRLSDKVQALTLRPQVGGIYSQLEGGIPSLANSLGGSNAVAATASGSASLGAVADVQLGDIAVPDARLDRASPAYFAGLTWASAPGFSPGQVWEDRYGDTPMNWPIAASQFSADVGYNAQRAQNWARATVEKKRGGYAFSSNDNYYMLARPTRWDYPPLGGWDVDNGPKPRGVAPKKPKYKPRAEMRVPNMPAMRALLRGQ